MAMSRTSRARIFPIEIDGFPFKEMPGNFRKNALRFLQIRFMALYIIMLNADDAFIASIVSPDPIVG
jgi:hypothetical protein